jgi:hypothetical protein
LNIKGQQIEANKELQQARLQLGECSLIAEPQKWNTLLDNVQKLAIKVFQITNELKILEGKFILSSVNDLICLFIDIHVNTHHRVLPY